MSAVNLNESELRCLREGIVAALHQRPISAWVVGSFARGQEIRSSDLDLLIQAPQALALSDMAALRAWFDASDLAYVVDLVDYHQMRTAPSDRRLMPDAQTNYETRRSM